MKELLCSNKVFVPVVPVVQAIHLEHIYICRVTMHAKQDETRTHGLIAVLENKGLFRGQNPQFVRSFILSLIFIHFFFNSFIHLFIHSLLFSLCLLLY